MSVQTTGGFHFPTTGITVNQAVLLAIDDHSLPLRRHLCYFLSKPTPRIKPVMTPSRDNPSAPDYLATQFYGTVLYDQGRYRMWHYAINPGEKPGQLHEGPICYAESPDGLIPTVGSMLPPWAPFVMPVRIAAGAAEPWEILVAVGGTALAAVALVWVGSRVYAGALLRIGGKVKLLEAWRSASE